VGAWEIRGILKNYVYICGDTDMAVTLDFQHDRY